MNFSPLILEGKSVAAQLQEELKSRIAELTAETQKQPCLAVLMVGDDPASEIYVRKKQRTAEELGIKSLVYKLPKNISQVELLKKFQELNEDPKVHGILLQLPLPPAFDSDPLLFQINPQKDVDGLHPLNLGGLVVERPYLIPCTPAGIMHLLQHYNLEVAGKRALVMGRSRLVGRPIAQLLTNASATVTVTHRQTSLEQLEDLVSKSDILVVAIGRSQFVPGEWIKRGAVVIDVGMNRLSDGSLAGDVDFLSCSRRAKAITPVPGGVGPLTVAHLIKNTVKAFELQCLGYSSIE